MAAEDNDIELWRRIDVAMEALPRPDRGRLARIEEALPARASRWHLPRFLAAALMASTAVAAGAAYWVGTASQPDKPEISPPGSEVKEAPGTQARDDEPEKGTREEPTREGTQPSDSVIYQR